MVRLLEECAEFSYSEAGRAGLIEKMKEARVAATLSGLPQRRGRSLKLA
ncbi:MAG: hypothetical protein NZ919_02450 [Candidatus Caldarchaeum sp.]|nr:hypothetical protein [Candidatus Caldarchaeum sp.]